jgi:hypothetical protein
MGGREVDHPRHKEWLAERAAYNREFRRRKKEREQAMGKVVREVGRPLKERCICPNCGSEHIKKPGPTWEVARVERGYYKRKTGKPVQLPIKWGGKE